ncbi:bacterial ammonia monooxygenase, subunit AmoB [Extensimonas sp. H3M7-6]|jgi:methane/ammonia monooxygenase subunit B|uniref:bacterial ammonia monooxygenase, subunit AmoB n=1 Tax=Extensimonas soli TaxID=3031322 RepID=UPI0023DAE262|nr:bacterial ammonia monooxygenase, subunit AmoB [Extensimonas sp. H3M7-6]MDF1482278.1 methane monooxygenase/ammonia monooxygenase subunit B [Extensimonas sp. H3M7-6]
MIFLLKRITMLLMAVSALMVGLMPGVAMAHGERATEPYIRTRTVHWYDVKWSTEKVNVNDQVVVTGKFRLFGDWPEAVSLPNLTYLGNGAPSAMLVREETYINGIPARQSHKDLVLGRDYDFKIVLRGRVPGKWHFHPMLNVSGAGPIIGPGDWIEVVGNRADFKQSLTTMHGLKIDDLETYGVKNAQIWQAGHVLLAIVWLLWWLRRPLIIPRWRAKEQGRDDLLVTRTDDRMAVVFFVVVLAVVIIGFTQVKKNYPQLVPLQAGVEKPEPLPAGPQWVTVKYKRAEYDVPGRSMRIVAEFENLSDRAVTIGEFDTANLRFVNKASPVALKAVDPKYPKELLPAHGLVLDKQEPLQPGEKRTVVLNATDAAWEVERLVSFLTNVDSRTGGLIFFYDEKGNRSISEVSGPILPVFKGARI